MMLGGGAFLASDDYTRDSAHAAAATDPHRAHGIDDCKEGGGWTLHQGNFLDTLHNLRWSFV